MGTDPTTGPELVHDFDPLQEYREEVRQVTKLAENMSRAEGLELSESLSVMFLIELRGLRGDLRELLDATASFGQLASGGLLGKLFGGG